MTGFYLTGSINVPTIQDAFRLVGERLQPGVTRVPDGEPGDRANWVLTQADHFLKNSDPRGCRQPSQGPSGATVSFGALDYHSIAAESYAEFKNAREDGVLKRIHAFWYPSQLHSTR